MLKISNYLSELGFNLTTQSDGSFHGSYISENCLEINTIFIDSKIGMEVNFNGLKRTILDSTIIHTVDELVFILSRNVFLKSQFHILYKEMIQSQTLSDVKHP